MNTVRSQVSKIIFIFFVLAENPLLAHQGEIHGEESPKEDPSLQQSLALNRINKSYMAGIEPIFERTCFDCHSSSTRYPWYAGLPGVKGLIASDIAEARSHLDMSAGFPFEGHGKPAEDLQAIRTSIAEDRMPPWRYKALHWGARLTEQEKTLISSWVHQSLELLDE